MNCRVELGEKATPVSSWFLGHFPILFVIFKIFVILWNIIPTPFLTSHHHPQLPSRRLVQLGSDSSCRHRRSTQCFCDHQLPSPSQFHNTLLFTLLSLYRQTQNSPFFIFLCLYFSSSFEHLVELLLLNSCLSKIESEAVLFAVADSSSAMSVLPSHVQQLAAPPSCWEREKEMTP